MYEKLSTDGKAEGGGEYGVQTGYGWTNGAILDLLVRYKDTIKYIGADITPPKDCKCKHKMFPINPEQPENV
jgi:alpha,alpha-trehalase